MPHQRHHGWAAVASLPLLGVRDAVRYVLGSGHVPLDVPLRHFP